MIKALRRHGDAVVQAELERVSVPPARTSADDGPRSRRSSAAIAAKLLHDPIVGLKEREEPAARAHAALLAELLGLSTPTRVTPLRIGDPPLAARDGPGREVGAELLGARACEAELVPMTTSGDEGAAATTGPRG